MSNVCDKDFLPFSVDFAKFLMSEALKEAEEANTHGDVPIGAVVAIGEKIISRAHNEIELKKDATRHAEILAIQRASQVKGDWRLSNAILCVTVEPCPMCAGAIRQARVGTIIYGCKDPQRGALGSLFDLSLDPRLGVIPRVISGVYSDKAQNLLQTFFREKRL